MTGLVDKPLRYMGQALVRFANVYGRDLLINNSPHLYEGVDFHIVRHNQGRNWRGMFFNRECWLMLLGFPLDHWINECIQNAIASFGRVLLWKMITCIFLGYWFGPE
jgi:hypothetical protein